MRALIILSVLFLLVLAIAMPIGYLVQSSKLPPLDSEFDLERQLKGIVEGQRMAVKAGAAEDRNRSVAFAEPDLSHYPKDLVALYISDHGCPSYFQTPRETGWAWAWRMLSGELVGSRPAGDGRCERIFALYLAQALKIPAGSQQAIAAHKIHNLLQKDQLVAYDLATAYFDNGVIGVDDAARTLFRRNLDSLPLEQLAEVALAMAPNWNYPDLKVCHNASLLRQARDNLIELIRNAGLIPDDRARAAEAQPVSCAAR